MDSGQVRHRARGVYLGSILTIIDAPVEYAARKAPEIWPARDAKLKAAHERRRQRRNPERTGGPTTEVA